MRIEGINYELDWQEFTVGSSFFVPCLDDAKARERIESKMNRLGYAVIIKLVIEDGIRGLRVWRTKRTI
jgi:biotin carboxylase